MRKLIINREKSFVGSLSKCKVYVRSTDNKGIKFRKEKYKKLGTLKNGEEAVFQIPDEETKILVVPSTIYRDYCNDIAGIPVGVNDVRLSGKMVYNPFLYNPFQFSDPVSEETMKNRKKNKKFVTFLCVFYILLILIGGLIGFSLAMAESEPKTFSVDEMQITLTEDFSEIKFDDYDAGFTNHDYLSITVIKDDIKSTEEHKDLTLEEFGINTANYIQENYLGEYGGYCSDFKSENGFYYIEYQINYEDGTANYYKEYFYEVTDGFWRVCFGCATEQKYIAYYNSFDEWASSVTFTEAV